jgi:hypothetical protein
MTKSLLGLVAALLVAAMSFNVALIFSKRVQHEVTLPEREAQLPKKTDFRAPMLKGLQGKRSQL